MDRCSIHFKIIGAAQGMARDSLKGFYNSELWKKQRLCILHRDKFTCTEPGCQAVATEVHHIIELNESNVNDINISLNQNNLRSLCHECHTRITKEMKCGKQNILNKIVFDENGFPVEVKQ